MLLRPNDTLERCGVLLKDGNIVEVHNLAPNPEIGYEMDPVALLPYLPVMTATWHTHPDGPASLSGADHEGFLRWPDLEHIIISPNAVRRYKVEDGVVLECD